MDKRIRLNELPLILAGSKEDLEMGIVPMCPITIYWIYYQPGGRTWRSKFQYPPDHSIVKETGNILFDSDGNPISVRINEGYQLDFVEWNSLDFFSQEHFVSKNQNGYPIWCPLQA